MKTTKSTLYTIIVLLVIFAPLATYGTFMHFKHQVPKEEVVDPNPNKEFYHNGILYFYDENKELLGTYTCNGECGYAKSIIDEDVYGIKNYYQEGTLENIEVANKDYVFLEDAGKISLYSISINKAIIQYQSLKDYHTSLDGNLILAKKDNKWGILSLDTMQTILPFEYDFLSLPNIMKDDKLSTDELIALKDNKWYIIDKEGNTKNTGLTDTILAYNSRYILTSKNELYDYNNNSIKISFPYKTVTIVGKYLVFVTNNNVVQVYDNLDIGVIKTAIIGDYKTIEFKISDNIINVFIDGTVGTSIDLNN